MSLSFVQPAASGARPLGSPPPAPDETCRLPAPKATRILVAAAATTLLGELSPLPRGIRPTRRGLLSALVGGLLLLLVVLGAAPPPRPHLVAALPPVPPLATGAVPLASPTPAPMVTARSLGVLAWAPEIVLSPVPTAPPPTAVPTAPPPPVPTVAPPAPPPRPRPQAAQPSPTARPTAAPAPRPATATPWWPDFTPAPTPVRGPITPTAGTGYAGNDWCQICYDRSATIKGPGPTPVVTP